MMSKSIILGVYHGQPSTQRIKCLTSSGFYLEPMSIDQDESQWPVKPYTVPIQIDVVHHKETM